LNKALLISATASNVGKTLLSSALLYHFKERVRPYKCGPDFIDPQFHEAITATPSINLDGFCLDKEQQRWMFVNYFDKEVAIIEGVMGYYDGMDKGASAYDVAKTLQVPTLLVLDGSGSYITLSAIIKGLCEFQKDNTIKGVIFNRLSSKSHYELIKKTLQRELPHIQPLGWIKKDLPSLGSTHLGLDLADKNAIEPIAKDVLEHIDLEALEKIMHYQKPSLPPYPFAPIEKNDAVCTLVQDENFSFVYHDNLCYLKEKYKKLHLIKAIKDEAIPQESDIVILPGGYVETNRHYNNIKDATTFKNSLISHVKNGKKVYAECAGLIYLGKKIDEKTMSGILDIEFSLSDKRERLGYYYAKELSTQKILKGHAFHYSKVTSAPQGDILLYKSNPKRGNIGGWIKRNIYATYLHSFWRESNVL